MSNPQEKAEELVLTYLKLQEPNYNWFHKGLAKQCALIAVKEILEGLKEYDERTENYLKKDFPDYFSFELQNMEQDLRFYEQVKKEIELL
jgi:hypothetical protein